MSPKNLTHLMSSKLFIKGEQLDIYIQQADLDEPGRL
jgi:hypothetical protein